MPSEPIHPGYLGNHGLIWGYAFPWRLPQVSYHILKFRTERLCKPWQNVDSQFWQAFKMKQPWEQLENHANSHLGLYVISCAAVDLGWEVSSQKNVLKEGLKVASALPNPLCGKWDEPGCVFGTNVLVYPNLTWKQKKQPTLKDKITQNLKFCVFLLTFMLFMTCTILYM